jgi:signal transduction histidine kinase/ActR/RegA family two-component response regulator
VHSYPAVILVLGAVAAYIGLENLFFFGLLRQPMYGWVALAGLTNGAYCYVSSKMYAAPNPTVGSYWQCWQLTVGSLLLTSSLFLGLEYLGRLGRRHYLIVLVPAILMAILVWVPGLGFSQIPATKHVAWLGVTYHEMALGPAPTVLFVVCAGLMGYVTVLLLRRAWRGSRQDRVMAVVLGLWLMAGVNDMLVASGVYSSIYLIEFSFFIIVVLVASMLLAARHRTGMETEQARRQLALEVLAKDRDLATAQAELTQAAKLAAVGHLAAGVAHEVNNPLTYVMTNLQILEAELAGNRDLRDLAQEALGGARRIATVVQQLSAFARPEAATRGGAVRVAVESAARLASVQLKDRARLEVEVPELPRVTMAEGQLAQVLLNLLVNAAHAIPPGSRDKHRVRVQARGTENVVKIVVTDTGGGIPDSVLPHIFEPFFTTKKVGQGQGLGLAISKSLIDKAGGRIVADNAPEGGARVTIELPLYQPPADQAQHEEAPPEDVAASAPPAAAGRAESRLLLVDDDEVVLRSLRRTLSRAFEVATARSGKQALELVARGHAFDLLLCDLMMPDGSGLEVAETLARSHPELLPRLILMTGGAPESEKTLLAKMPSVPVLQKPFGLEDLLRLVDRAKDPQQSGNRW